MLDINQIKYRYLTQMTDSDFSQLVSMVKEAQDARRNSVKARMAVGDIVEFNTPNGLVQHGKIIKKMPKNIKVKVGMTTWTVSPNLLKIVTHAPNPW